jgi:hypothetical protein
MESGFGLRLSGFGKAHSASAEARWLKPEARLILALFWEKTLESTLAVAKM